ncbi:MAG: hypothetical protein ACU83N_01490 [Gammaproteobacteria bacterium]
MNRLARMSCLISILFSSHPASALDDIEIATLNQYLGADLTPVLTASNPEAFNAALVDVLTEVAQSDFPARAEAQTQAIAKRSPAIAGLQEVWLLSCIDANPADNLGCEDPDIADAFADHLTLTLDALTATGVSYYPAAVVKNLDLSSGIPFSINDVEALLIAVDRDVILARDDVDTDIVDLTSICSKPSEDGCNYQVAASATTPAGDIPIERGFVAVDAMIGNRNYRIFNTHLEVKGEDVGNPLFTFYQAAQAAELIAIAATTPPDRTLLILGDMNSSPDQDNIPGLFPPPFQDGIITPYKQFANVEGAYGDYYDIWALRPGKVPGYSCCQKEDLSNHQSALFERIDMIFSWDEPAKVKQARMLGDKVSSKTAPPGQGLWPTDHGGIAASIQFPTD